MCKSDKKKKNENMQKDFHRNKHFEAENKVYGEAPRMQRKGDRPFVKKSATLVENRSSWNGEQL